MIGRALQKLLQLPAIQAACSLPAAEPLHQTLHCSENKTKKNIKGKENALDFQR